MSVEFTREDDIILHKLSGKTVLITGAGGLIGSSFVDLLMSMNGQLDNKITIRALGRKQKKLSDRFSAYAGKKELQFVIGDVVDFREITGPVDYIVHAASPAHPIAYSRTPVDVMKANLLGTMNMLEIARQAKARLLFVSSGEIYGISNEEDKSFVESDSGYIDIQNPRSCYPESKRAAETLCASYGAQYAVDTVVARMCHIYGPYITDSNTRADAQFLRNALAQEDIVMKSKGEQVRSYCYVEDAVRALLYILVNGSAGEAYNVANRKSIASIHEYAETLAGIAGVRIRTELPSQEESKGYTLVSRAVLNAGKLEALGWEPKYDLRGGLETMLSILKPSK